MNLKIKKFDLKFLKEKYNYDVTQVIGVKGKERYILYTDKKLLRIYRDKLKSSALLSTYIPIEDAIFYNFTVESAILDKIDLDTFIETKVYDEAGLLETEKYIIKYKIINKLKNEKEVLIQTVIVPENYLNKNYNDILEETGYIDYISFPAFAYKTLYDRDILKKANDVFIVVLFDKIFLTFYSEGKLLYINTISGGLNKIYDGLSELNIKNFDLDLFKKLLTKKGFLKEKYINKENMIYDILSEKFANRIGIINEQILNVIENYNIDKIDRIFIISEFGAIPGINDYIKKYLNINSFGFEFYEKYNLDRLSIDPFLFLGMLESAHAYQTQELEYNYSLFLRKPKFIFRTSGILILSTVAVTLLFSSYPLFLYIRGVEFKHKSQELEIKLKNINNQKNQLKSRLSEYKKQKALLYKKIKKNERKIKFYQKLISDIYRFKFSYIPKSQEIVDLTLLMNRYNIFLKSMTYKDNMYTLDIYTYDDGKIAKFISSLVNNGFNVYFDKITKTDNGKYTTTVRIEE